MLTDLLNREDHDILIVCVSGLKGFNKDAAEKALDDLEAKWGEDYPIAIKSWCDNWNRMTAYSKYFQYSQHIRRIIYTTNRGRLSLSALQGNQEPGYIYI